MLMKLKDFKMALRDGVLHKNHDKHSVALSNAKVYFFLACISADNFDEIYIDDVDGREFGFESKKKKLRISDRSEGIYLA